MSARIVLILKVGEGTEREAGSRVEMTSYGMIGLKQLGFGLDQCCAWTWA